MTCVTEGREPVKLETGTNSYLGVSPFLLLHRVNFWGLIFFFKSSILVLINFLDSTIVFMN